MKAIILAGGFGTRLRPLTLTQAKPSVDFANKPMVVHQIEALVAAGVDTVIMATNKKMGELLADLMKEHEKRIGIKIVFSLETEPLGTAGPLGLAKDLLAGDEPFFVLNSDVISEFPFAEMMAFHRQHDREGTISVTKVDQPSKYGVVLFDEASGEIREFVEKPKEFVGNRINAGMYVLNPSVLDRIPAGTCSIEQEIFPLMVQSGNLYAYVCRGFWMDVGQPTDYLKGVQKYLNYHAQLKDESPVALATGENIVPPVLIDPSARVGTGGRIGPNVVIGANVVIEDGVRIQNTTILSDTVVGKHTFIKSTILGRKCTIGKWVRMENECIIGDDVHVKDELYLNGPQVLPHKSISNNIHEPIIIM